jgi:hypothetical protein
MFNVCTYFEETALPPSGIDRISVEIDELQAEAINPRYNILEQIIYHLTGLTIHGILHNYSHYPPDLISRFYRNYLNRVVRKLQFPNKFR